MGSLLLPERAAASYGKMGTEKEKRGLNRIELTIGADLSNSPAPANRLIVPEMEIGGSQKAGGIFGGDAAFR